MRTLTARLSINSQHLARAVVATLALTLAANSIALAAPPDPIQIHNTLTARGIGKGVKVAETDGTTVTGKIVAIRDDSFDLMPKGTTQPSTIAYAQISKVQNHGLSTGTKVVIGVTVGVLVAATVIAVVALRGLSSLKKLSF